MLDESDSKALSEFTKVLHNPTTKKHYLYHLGKYLAWIDKTPDQAIIPEVKEIQASIEDYCKYLKDVKNKVTKKKHSRSYIKLAFSSLFLFFAMNYKEVNKTRISKMILPQDKRVGGIAYETEDVRKILEAIDKTKITKKGKRYPIKTQLRSRALVHFLASSGCRVGAVPDVQFKDLERIDNCYSVKIYSGSMLEYVTFLIPEATKALDEYLKSRNLEHEGEFYRWGSKHGKRVPKDEMSIFYMSYEAIRLCLNRLVRRAKLQEIKKGERYDKQTIHAFRKRFNTILKSNKDINPNLIEVMMGHSTTIALDNPYLTPNKEKLFAEFQKGIDELSIFNKNNTTNTI